MLFFCHFLYYSFYIITWNVSTKFPDHISIDKLFGLDSDPKNDIHRPDFYIIGLQEINSQPQHVVKGLFKDDPWTNKFKELLKIRDYVAIKSEQMQGLFLIIFAKRHHLLHIREVEAELTRTGLGGIWVKLYNYIVLLLYCIIFTKQIKINFQNLYKTN